LRSMHVFEENKRVDAEEQAIKNSDFKEFLRLVNESGLSSELYLQNITPESAGGTQPMALALAICRRILDDCGAVRVHGGGFGGTIQAYVPIDRKKELKEKIEGCLGEKTCTEVYIRSEGCTIIN
jgi:galactokinase